MFPLFTLLLATLSTNVESKGSKLNLLALLPYSNTDEINGKMCQLAMQVAVDGVNARADILPDFEVVPQYKDDACRGDVALKQFLSFVSEKNEAKTVVQSPVVIGTVCSAGCQYVGSMIHEYQSVQIAIACNSPRLALRRDEYPNLFRTTPTSLSYHAPRSMLIQQIGKWRKIVIVTDTNGLNYPDADSFYRFVNLKMPQVDVTRFEVVYTINDEFIDSLMNRYEVPPRIIFAFLSKQNYVQFVCSAYSRGIRGSKYLFVSSLVFIPPPDYPLPSECGTRAAFEEQLKITVWIGAVFTVDKPMGQTDLGYGLEEFEQRFNELSNGSQFPTYEQRHRCHDVMMHALLTLDKADKKLRANGRSLLEAIQNDKHAAGQAVKRSASSMEFDGLRGHYRYSKEEGEMEENFQITQLINRQLRRGYQCRGNCSRGLQGEKGGLLWTTTDGQPPRDAPTHLDLSTDTGEQVFKAFQVLAIGLAASEFTGCGLIWGMAKYLRRTALSAMPISNIMLVVGCLLMCPTSLLYAFNYNEASREIMRLVCYARTALPVVAHSLINSVILVKLWRLYELVHTPTLRPSRKHDLYAVLSCLFFIAACLIYMGIWFILSPRDISRIDIFNYRSDAFDIIEHAWYWQCSGEDNMETRWVTGFAGIQAFPLMIALFLAYNVHNFRRRQVVYDTTYIRLIAFKQAGLGLITLVSYICIETVPYHNLFYASLVLIDSASTSYILVGSQLVSNLRKLLRRCFNVQRRRTSSVAIIYANQKAKLGLPDVAMDTMSSQRAPSQIAPKLTARDDISRCDSILRGSTMAAQQDNA